MTVLTYQMCNANYTTQAKQRRIFRLRRTIVLAVLLAVSFTFGAIVQASAQDDPNQGAAAAVSTDPMADAQLYGEKVIVEPGMTLWEIASVHKPSKMDIREYVNKIKRYNQLKSSGLQVGQVLYLP